MAPDLKPRSRDVTDGLEKAAARGMRRAGGLGGAGAAKPQALRPRSGDVTDGWEKAAARGMLRAVGMGDADFAKPQIGVASSWNEITPCNLSLDRRAAAVNSGGHP